jgi:glycerophosphoryl diester phosphodiesterase
MARRGLLVLLAVALGLFALNTSLLAHPRDEYVVMAHRGVYQNYDKRGLGRDDCTATRIFPPTHAFLENTIPSIRAAIGAGAGMIEIDVHPTTDGEFAVFHDWTIDCRTDGSGVTREQSWATLRGLDIGYGYTADGGKTYPFRGKGIGMMPSLGEVLTAFPQTRFLINIKSNDAAEADKLDAYLTDLPDARPARLAVFGGEAPVARMRNLRPDMPGSSRAHLKACARDYLLLGWTGYMPAPCHNTIVFVPVNWGWAVWGYPNRFLTRMQAADTQVFLLGPLGRRLDGMPGVDDARAVAMTPKGWRGGVSTDRVEVTGPMLRAKAP